MNTYKDTDGTVHTFTLLKCDLSGREAMTTIREDFGDDTLEHSLPSKSVGVFCRMLKDLSGLGLNYSICLEASSNAVAGWEADHIYN